MGSAPNNSAKLLPKASLKFFPNHSSQPSTERPSRGAVRRKYSHSSSHFVLATRNSPCFLSRTASEQSGSSVIECDKSFRVNSPLFVLCFQLTDGLPNNDSTKSAANERLSYKMMMMMGRRMTSHYYYYCAGSKGGRLKLPAT